MKISASILVVLCLAAFSRCSNTRFLAEDEMLYTGRKNVELINSHDLKKTAAVKNYVESVTNHKVNNSLFGRRVLPPIGLWVHNYIRKEDKKKFRNWINRTFSSDPILISDVNPELRAQKLENELFDMGYFNTKAWSEINIDSGNPHKAKVSYFVDLAPPYHFNKILIDTLSTPIDSLISKDQFMTEIKPGEKFDLTELKTAREGLSRRLQDLGYFYIIPEFIDLVADTTIGDYKLNLEIGRKKDLPQQILSVYRINKILINNVQGKDTAGSNPISSDYGGITIVSKADLLKSDVLINSIYFKKGDVYSYSAYQNTISRLNNLGVFKYVNISYTRDKADSLANLLNVNIDLIMSDNISLDVEGNLVTKSSGYFGPLISTGVSHGNAFQGAERLKVGLTGGFEWQWGTKSETQLGTYSYQFGINSGLTLPRIVYPFNKEKKSSLLMQRTGVNLDLSLLNRTAYYKMFSAKTSLDYAWSKVTKIRHSFSPVYLNSVNLLATTPEFDSVVAENIYIRKSFEEQFILGMKYEFSYNNTLTVRPNNFLFQGGIGTSGNLLDLFGGIGKTPEERPYYFLQNIYSQYIKLTGDFRYYRNGYKKSLVFRLYAGVGMPYLNSSALPYVEQFFSGGAYSIRGFTARYLGPGSYHSEDQSGYIDQSGDIKLETNLEYRFDISKVLKAALFVDAGNIWLTTDDPLRPGAAFSKNTFFKEIAVSSGIGVRLDFSFFVLRVDYGVPFRNPYMTDEGYWLIGHGNKPPPGLFHLAIGYPF